jgi:hypothetical protein
MTLEREIAVQGGRPLPGTLMVTAGVRRKGVHEVQLTLQSNYAVLERLESQLGAQLLHMLSGNRVVYPAASPPRYLNGADFDRMRRAMSGRR